MIVIRRSALALALALAACAGPGAPPSPPAPGSVVARFDPGGAQDVIEVSVRGRAGARAVALIGPDGGAEAAYRIDVQPARRAPREHGALPPGAGPALGIPGAPTRTTLTDEIVTTAFVRVPDIIDYRRNWQAYRIRIEFGETAAAPGAVTLPAPPPG
jgi:hypothetical protein